jgi:YEATS domain-containing protein 4
MVCHFLVLSAPPYEVNETGWGEFEVIIELVFRDSKIKPVKLFHLLKLYPLDALPSEQTLQLDAPPVLYERYDELLFLEPQTAYMSEVFANFEDNPSDYPAFHSVTSTLTDNTEEEERLCLMKALDIVKKQLTEWNDTRERSQRMISILREELMAAPTVLESPSLTSSAIRGQRLPRSSMSPSL